MTRFVRILGAVAIGVGLAGLSVPAMATELKLTIDNKSELKLEISDETDQVQKPSNSDVPGGGNATMDVKIVKYVKDGGNDIYYKGAGTAQFKIERTVTVNDVIKQEHCIVNFSVSVEPNDSGSCKTPDLTFDAGSNNCAMDKKSCSGCSCTLEFTSTW